MMDLVNAVLEGAEKLDAQTQFPHDRSKYMNASEAATCIRRQWYGKKGTKQDFVQDWGYARRGSHGEKYVIDALRASGLLLLAAGEDQESLTDDELKIAGTPDGVVVEDPSADRLLLPEIKTIDPRSNVGKLPKPEHVEQSKICQYLVAKRSPDSTVTGCILYMDASNYNLLYQFKVGPPTASDVKRWKRRASKILRSRNVDNLDREGKQTGECRRCPFVKTCGVKMENGGAQKRANRGSSLHEAAERIVQLKAEKGELEKEESALKEDIKQELAKRKLRKTTVGDIYIAVSVVAGRTSLDRKAVEAAGIDLTPFEKQSAPSERLEVKRQSAA